MKKIIFLGAAAVLFPAIALAQNSISMVTYFPVPYVAYSQVNVTGQMDIGLTKACEMALGSTNLSEISLWVGQGNSGSPVLPDAAERGLFLKQDRLNLNGGNNSKILSNTVTLGHESSNDGEPASLKFAALTFTTLTGTSLQVDGKMEVDNLELFEMPFPSCGGTMSWKRLNLKDGEKVFLVCGATTEDDGSSTPPVTPEPPKSYYWKKTRDGDINYNDLSPFCKWEDSGTNDHEYKEYGDVAECVDCCKEDLVWGNDCRNLEGTACTTPGATTTCMATGGRLIAEDTGQWCDCYYTINTLTCQE